MSKSRNPAEIARFNHLFDIELGFNAYGAPIVLLALERRLFLAGGRIRADTTLFR